MATDGYLVDQYKAIGDTYLHYAEDRAEFARKQADHWAVIAKTEKRVQDRNRADQGRSPGGHFAAAREALNESSSYRRTPSGMLRTATPPAPKPDQVEEILNDISNPEKP